MGHCTSLRRLFGFALAGLLLAAVATFLSQGRQKSVNAKAERILVEKGARRLTLFCAGRKLKEYRVALGFSPIGSKQHEGDGRTPEGKYTTDFHKSDSAFHRALHISYPYVAHTARAEEVCVAPGGDIMNH